MRTALVGVDGTGKTTVARQLRGIEGVTVIHAIRPHDDPGSPYAELSEHLATASAVADRVAGPRIKLALLFLQLSLYHPQESEATTPAVLADRHPLIDPLVYLPLYGRLARRVAAIEDEEQQWWSAQPPETARVVRDWLRECAGERDAAGLGAELLDLAALSRDELRRELGRLFPVDPPDQVVLLEVPVAEALARIRRRSPGAEMHETATALETAREAYREVVRWLEPRLRIYRVDASGPPSDVAGEVARRI